MAKLKISHTYSNPDGTTTNVDSYISPQTINGAHYGGTGGNTAFPGRQIRIKFYDGSTLQNGYIITQKGDRDFRVNTAANTGTTTVTLVNAQSGELTVANTATIVCNVATFAGANVANIGTGGGGYTNNRAYAYLTWTAANVAGYSTPVVGYQMTGTGLTGNVTIVAINTATNVTVSVPTQTVSTAQASITETLNPKNITNKFVTDWNGTKWRYRFAAPYTDGAGVLASQPAWQGNTMISVDSVN